MRISDWSSDLGSSDLARNGRPDRRQSLAGCSRRDYRTGDEFSNARAREEGGVRLLQDEAERRTRCVRPGDDRARLRGACASRPDRRSEEHTSELQSLMRISYAVFCLKKKKKNNNHN